MLKHILIIAILNHCVSMKLLGKVCIDPANSKRYCCHNTENINGKCTDCQAGTYAPYGGRPCIVCPQNRYGPRCILSCTTCRDLTNYRCDPVVGCVFVPDESTTETATSYNATTVAATYDTSTVTINLYFHTRQEGIQTIPKEEIDSDRWSNLTFLYSICLTVIFILLFAIFCGTKLRKRQTRQKISSNQNNVPELIEIGQLEERPYHMYHEIDEIVLSYRKDQSKPRDNENPTDNTSMTPTADVAHICPHICPVDLGIRDRSDYLDPCFIAFDDLCTAVLSDDKARRSSTIVSSNTPKETDIRYPIQYHPLSENAVDSNASYEYQYQSLERNAAASSIEYQKLHQSLQGDDENGLIEEISEDDANKKSISPKDPNSSEYFELCVSPGDLLLWKIFGAQESYI